MFQIDRLKRHYMCQTSCPVNPPRSEALREDVHVHVHELAHKGWGASLLFSQCAEKS